MKSALEGLNGVTKVEMDLRQDLFRVTLADTNAPTKDDLFKAMLDLTYTPTLENGSTFAAAPEVSPPAEGIPPLIQKALNQAKTESKRFVLVEGTGDN